MKKSVHMDVPHSIQVGFSLPSGASYKCRPWRPTEVMVVESSKNL